MRGTQFLQTEQDHQGINEIVRNVDSLEYRRLREGELKEMATDICVQSRERVIWTMLRGQK